MATGYKLSGLPAQHTDESTDPLAFFVIGDPDITCEIVGPRLESGGHLRWLRDKSHTINGHSLVFRLTFGRVRAFFSGDLNRPGSDNLLNVPNSALDVNAHIFKAPHHGSHEFIQALFGAVRPMITVVSAGEVPDHGHPGPTSWVQSDVRPVAKSPL